MLKNLLLSFFVIIGILYFVASGIFFTKHIKKIDEIYLGANIRNSLGILLNENWNKELSPAHYAPKQKRFHLIAHAGGLRNSILENKISAFDIARSKGLNTFELDIILENGSVVCANKLGTGEHEHCDISKYFTESFPKETILIDIKSDFYLTLDYLARDSSLQDFTQSMIIQIYHPDQLKHYEHYSDKFLGYVFSLYKSHRKLNHVCSQLVANNIPYIVVSTKKLETAEKECVDISFIVHPVLTCHKLEGLIDNQRVLGAMVSGNALKCQ